ncbi:nesprin-1-like [Anguilla anguilla]|uniref:nesprin-1-like n=1 Tax=Anguilla anguilla TaxID=7936 RepID=UPI0015B2E3A7|nr:nesprin-1-like [Anguilla anguilla]XP_035251216.1 nesprin-1-like [Anguilla anguilla]XP_035251225.1 nesprin-1-like [Anguilla anguilla]XP_035251235.1 nesprin-1-like [Anguilla anguilla]
MESEVWGDISIEEMIEKLHKDFQEEMTVVLENRRKLERVGSCLAQVSREGMTSETQPNAEGTREHWQHLLNLNGARVKRLQKTLIAVEQLEKNMSSLQSWLAHIETKLSDPITYHTCDSQEIQRKLSQQQDIQRDIEEHSTGMESVLSLCEAMLQDCDVCDTDTQFDSIQQASRTLEQQWRTVQATSAQRINQIKETGSLWERFMEDFSCFEDWLQASEKMAALPSSSGLLYTAAKQELKKLKALEQQVQGNVTQLDIIIRQYQHLEREDRTDDSCQLRDMVHDGKQRWEALNDMVASGLHRLKEFIGVREAFESARDAVLIWVTTIDLQLTNIEHFSECDPEDKFTLFQVLQEEISLNAGKIEDTIHQGELLIQRSEPLDATVIEEECAELHRYCKEVFSCVDCYQEKLIRLPFAVDEHGLSDPEESEELAEFLWNGCVSDSRLASPPSSAVLHMQGEDSGRGSPASADSIPLEWDHEYDLSHISAFHSGYVGSLDTYVQQPQKFLHTSHLYLTDWSDFVYPTSTESGTTDLIEHWELTPEQVSIEELCMKHDLHQGQQLNSHDLQRLWVGLGLAEAELDQLRGWDVRANPQTTELHIRRFKKIHAELTELRLMAKLPGDPSCRPLTKTESGDCLEAEEKEHHFRGRLEWLLKEFTRVIGELECAPDIGGGWEPQCKGSSTQPEPTVSTQQPRTHRGVSSALSCSAWYWQAFLRRVLWTALPLQFFFLVLLGLACLVPPTQEDHSYALAKILVQNLHPTLYYTHGPPPI